MLTTKKLRKVLELAEKYNYEGVVDWILPFLAVKTGYQELLSNKEYGCYKEVMEDLISLDEEPEIKDHRLALLDLFVENSKEKSEIERKAKALDILDPKRTWSTIQTPESRVLWDQAGVIPTYELQHKAFAYPIKLSSFEEIGKAVRAGVRVAGKPNFPSYQETRGTHNDSKKIGWRTTSVIRIFEIRKAMLEAGIRKFHIYADNAYLRLVICIPFDVFPEAFYTSDDVKIWKELHKKKENRLKVKKVTKALDKELSR